MNIIHDDDNVRVYFEEGEGNDTLVCFSGIDFDVFGFTPKNREIRPEFVKVTTGLGDRFWVIDKQRTWGCHIDWEWLSSFLSPRFEGKNVVALGNCMGGTNAIKFAYHADVHRVIAFTPHWSVNPEVMADHWPNFDKRTLPIRDKTNATGWKSLEGMFRPMTTYIHFWTPDIVDVGHMIKFPTLPNIKVLYMINCNHSVARVYKSHGILPKILGECITAKDPHNAISEILDSVGLKHELF